jgi:hypothetical protein
LQRANLDRRLAWHPQRFPAGRQDLHLGAGRQQRRDQRGAGAEQVLAGVQDEQQVTVAQLVDEHVEAAAGVLVRQPQRRRDRVRQQRLVP